MDGIKNILTKQTKDAIKPNKNIHSEAHYWADVISSAFGERKKFGMYLGIIKRVGVPAARQIFSEINESKATEPAKLFLWKTGKNNINITNVTANSNRT